MGLDITLHRKGTPYGEDFWFNGRNTYREIRDYMINERNYRYGEDYLLTYLLCEELKTIIINFITTDEDLSKKINLLYFHNALLEIQHDILSNNTIWYFEATW